MVSAEPVQPNCKPIESPTSPRISFSVEFLDDSQFISADPDSSLANNYQETDKGKSKAADFEFLSNNASSHAMLTADELFFEGKLLSIWQMQQSEKLKRTESKSKEAEAGKVNQVTNEEKNMGWYIDDDPSPRPPNCTVLWKELLRLKKQRPKSLSPSSSSSSTSSSSSSLAEAASKEEEGKDKASTKEKHVKTTTKKGLMERARTTSIKIRPMINVPICTQAKSTKLPPLFPIKKGQLERRDEL